MVKEPQVIYTDGACRGNPGLASAAAVAVDASGAALKIRARRLGKQTNNVAEWEGIVLALEMACEENWQNIIIRMDSKLVVNQFPTNGWRCNYPDLLIRRDHARALAKTLERVKVQYVPREQNKLADQSANDVLDMKIPHTQRDSEK